MSDKTYRIDWDETYSPMTEAEKKEFEAAFDRFMKKHPEPGRRRYARRKSNDLQGGKSVVREESTD